MMKSKNNLLQFYNMVLPLILLSLTLFVHFYGNVSGKMVTDSFISFISIFSQTLYIVMLMVILVNILLKKYTFLYSILIILFLLFLIYLTYNSEDSELLHHTTIVPYFLLILICKDIHFNLIIKTVLLNLLVLLCSIFIFSLNGELIFHLLPATNNRIRYGIGFFWHTFTFILCYITYYYVYYRKLNINYYEIFLLLLLSILSFFLTGTRSCLLYELLVLAFTFTMKKNNKLMKYKIIYTYIMFAIVFFSFFVYIVMTIYYDNNILWMRVLNNFFTGRLYLGNVALNEYKIGFLGDYKEFFASGININYVDSSFLRLLLTYGIIFYVCVLVCVIYFIILVNEKKDIYMSFIFSLIIIQASFDVTFLLTMLYASFPFILSYKNSEIIN